MLFIKHNNKDPYKNHAIEEFLMNKFNEDCFMLWENDKSILIGRNQNIYNEINIEYVKKNHIPVVRRLSGGGTVFNDGGNLNFSFISCSPDKDFANFKKFAKPIMEALNKLSIPAELSGRNDLMVDGKKISGNAQCRYKNKLLHHGTLLFSSDISELSHALKVSNLKLESKGVKSVKSRVSNIQTCLEAPMSIENFKDYLFDEVFKSTQGSKIYTITQKDFIEIDRIAKKYASWEWNFGNNPQFDIKGEKKFRGGIVQVYMNIHKGRIKDIKLYGDFFSENDVSIIEKSLKGINYNKLSICNALQKFNIDKFFKNISFEDIINLLI